MSLEQSLRALSHIFVILAFYAALSPLFQNSGNSIKFYLTSPQFNGTWDLSSTHFSGTFNASKPTVHILAGRTGSGENHNTVD